MSTAQVVNTLISPPPSRVSAGRGGVRVTSLPRVDELDTQLAARGRDDFQSFSELDDFETPRRRLHGNYFQDEAVRFAGVLLSREVGTTMMQAQAYLSRAAAPTIAPSQAERNVATYEFNQSLMGQPEVSTATGLMH